MTWHHECELHVRHGPSSLRVGNPKQKNGWRKATELIGSRICLENGRGPSVPGWKLLSLGTHREKSKQKKNNSHEVLVATCRAKTSHVLAKVILHLCEVQYLFTKETNIIRAQCQDPEIKAVRNHPALPDPKAYHCTTTLSTNVVISEIGKLDSDNLWKISNKQEGFGFGFHSKENGISYKLVERGVIGSERCFRTFLASSHASGHTWNQLDLLRCRL